MIDIIRSYLPFSEESYELLMDITLEKQVEKKQVLFRPNTSTTKILFIKKGLLRGYKLLDGKDFTHHFYFENWFATDYLSFLTEEPSEIYIESLEKTSYYEFNKKDLLNLFDKSHQLERLGRVIAENAFIATVDKMANLQLLILEERYNALIKRNPSLFQRVPQKHIASFFGVSEQSLSRIKK